MTADRTVYRLSYSSARPRGSLSRTPALTRSQNRRTMQNPSLPEVLQVTSL